MPVGTPAHQASSARSDHLGQKTAWLSDWSLREAETSGHGWQTQGPRAESSPPPCFIQPGTLFLPRCSTELLAPTYRVVTVIQS